MTDTQHLPLGSHVLVDAYDVENTALLNDKLALSKILRDAVKLAGATPLYTMSKQFEPQGVTVLVMLAESHASIHTYPEHAMYFLDIFTCGALDPTKAVQTLAGVIGGKCQITKLVRGDRRERLVRVAPIETPVTIQQGG